MTKWEDLVSDVDLAKVAVERKRSFEKKKVKKKEVQEYLDNGWEIIKTNKNGSASMKKPKKIGDSFEDEVWCVFYEMGFKTMNKSRDFQVSYSKNNPKLTKQIDVLAIDDEVVLMIECKETEKMNSNTTWKKELESINGYKSQIINELKTKYPNKNYVYIFATKNYVIGTSDKERMEDFKIENFEYDTILYYKQLANHLGSAARFQLLASLFSNTKIKGMDSRVPAIEGKMGGLTYYSFSIEPEKLLKLAYVLHRNNANRDNMPTYQRIIKKERLASVRKYINEGGYFPNSLIVSIDTKDRGVHFERSSLQVDSSISKIGILHLPQTYQSAYVIDGQHRLYGYSDSKYANNNTIPVVAFIDLDKKSQLKMFMDINENQKAVSKGLRNTLNIDMLWDSKKLSERNEALMLDIGQKLGEDKKSPLYDCIVTGENSTTKNRCITLEYIKEAFQKSDFFNNYKKNNDLVKQGTFAKQTNEDTEDNFIPFIKDYFSLISSECQEEWIRGSEGFLAINNTTFALIKILNDIVNIMLKERDESKVNAPKEFFRDIEPMILKLCSTLNELSEKEKNDIKTAKGGSAKNTSWRTLQIALRSKEPKFTNDDLEAYIVENCMDYKTVISDVFGDIKNALIERVKNKFEEYGDWYNNLISNDLKKDLFMAKAEKNYQNDNGDSTASVGKCDISYWELISFKEVERIIKYGRTWSDYLQSTFESDGGNRKTKMKVLEDIKALTTIENKLGKNQQIIYKDFQFIERIIQDYSISVNLEKPTTL